MTKALKIPALDPKTVSPRIGSAYPVEFAGPCQDRAKAMLGNALGLSQFGVNLVELDPGAWSSQRHWHEKEDEFVFVLEGEITLISDSGEQVLGPGMAAGFPAGREDGHHLINKTDKPARYLEVGTRSPEEAVAYPDIDMKMEREAGGESRFLSRAGEPLNDG